jgi:hypothetical protein
VHTSRSPLAALALLPLLALGLAAPARADLLVGVAEGDVTPATGTPLAGYGGRLRPASGRAPDLNPFDAHTLFEPSTGVRDPIEAQALVLERDGLVVALLTIDAIGCEDEFVTDIARAARAAGVPLTEDRLFVAASHTHSGPGALSRRPLWALAACDLFSRRVHRRLVQQTSDLLARAFAARRPARVGWGQVDVPGATRNRRAGTSKLVQDDDVDPAVRVLRVDDAAAPAGAPPLAVVMNYAVHGTCLSEKNLLFSADVPGALRRAVAAAVGCPVLFTNAAEGDVAPRPGGEDGLTAVPARVAPAVQALVRTITTRPDVSLAVEEVWRDLGHVVLHPGLLAGAQPGEDPGVTRTLGQLARRTPRALIDRLVTARFRYAALRLGDLVLLAVPGEPITAVGRRLGDAARAVGLEPWIVGLANGHMGYIVTAEEYAQGGYEAWLTLYGEETAADLEDAFAEVLRRLAPF